jgi:hypothetical protein
MRIPPPEIPPMMAYDDEDEEDEEDEDEDEPVSLFNYLSLFCVTKFYSATVEKLKAQVKL